MSRVLISRRRLVWQRDGGRCQLCGCECVRPKSGQTKLEPNTGTIDHIVPKSRGGTKCNQIKGDGVDPHPDEARLLKLAFVADPAAAHQRRKNRRKRKKPPRVEVPETPIDYDADVVATIREHDFRGPGSAFQADPLRHRKRRRKYRKGLNT
ncbi:MAG TPA: hypothetical protein ENK57_20430 [Polyangiaceae bacterium]|nr:hypothetical protein [Polyangiaceae bacterium]